MTPEQHERLARNMRLKYSAKRALLGRSDPDIARRDLAALFASDVDIGPELRTMLARFFSGDAESDRMPIAKLSGSSHKDWPRKVEARIDHLRRGLECEADHNGDRQEYAKAQRPKKVAITSIKRSLDIAQAFHRWFDHVMPWEFRDPDKLNMSQNDWASFLYETFAEWLLDNPGEDPLMDHRH